MHPTSDIKSHTCTHRILHQTLYASSQCQGDPSMQPTVRNRHMRAQTSLHTSYLQLVVSFALLYPICSVRTSKTCVDTTCDMPAAHVVRGPASRLTVATAAKNEGFIRLSRCIHTYSAKPKEAPRQTTASTYPLIRLKRCNTNNSFTKQIVINPIYTSNSPFEKKKISVSSKNPPDS